MSLATLHEVIPAELMQVVAQRRWSDLLLAAEARGTGAAGDGMFHVRGLALLGLRRFAEAASLLDHGRVGPPVFGEMIDAYGLASAGHGERAIRRLAFLRANRPQAERGSLAPLTLRTPAPRRLQAAAGELLGIAMAMGHRKESIEVTGGWQAVFPDDVEARFMHAATTGESAPDVAPPDYLRGHFNAFADGFEAALVGQLAYGTPAELHRALLPWMQAQGGELRILDAGCGTGLCGPLFRPHAQLLAGVDLSPGMLAVADAKGCYDVLLQSELTAALREVPPERRVDLIIAADVVMYFGELRPLLAAAHQALLPGGLFAFTVELQAEDGFALHPTGRYKHGRVHVEALLAEAGFGPITVSPTIIRNESGLPVEGLLLRASRGAVH